MAGETIESVFRDFQTAGVPSSGAHEPVKSEIRNLLNALVFGDAPGGAVIELNNAGTGTGNAIEVTTAEPIPDAAWKAVYVLNVTHENTGPVTVSINGAAAIPVVDNTGQPLIAGALVPGMGVLALDDGTNLRLFVYGDVEALLNEIRETTKPYLGASATAPTTRTDGSALVAGDQYFDTAEDKLKVWTGSAWIGGTGDVLSTNNGSDFEDPLAVPGNIGAMPVATYDPNGNASRVLFAEEDLADLSNKGNARENLGTLAVDENRLDYRSVALEVGFRDADYDAIKSTYGYDYLYPQDMDIDDVEGLLFIYKSTSGGSNSWQWVFVYDMSDGSLARTFSIGDRTREGIAVWWDGATRYLDVTTTGGDVLRKDITTLPAEKSRVTPDSTFAVDGYAQMAEENGIFTVQREFGNSIRSHFRHYDSSYNQVGETVFSTQATGTIASGYIDVFPKMQAIGRYKGELWAAFGGAIPYGDPASNGKLQGVRRLAWNGSVAEEALYTHDGFSDALAPALGYTASLIENEGICGTADGLYTLWVTLNVADREDPANAGKGVLILREMAVGPGRIDFSAARRTATEQVDPARIALQAAVSSTQVIDPISGTPINTFDELLDAVIYGNLWGFKFYGTNSVITDINGNDVPLSGSFITVTAASGVSAQIEIKGNAQWRRYWIAPATGTRVQYDIPIRIRNNGNLDVGNANETNNPATGGDRSAGVMLSPAGYWSAFNPSGPSGWLGRDGDGSILRMERNGFYCATIDVSDDGGEFVFRGGVSIKVVDVAPTEAVADGNVRILSTNGKIYVRSGGAWVVAGTQT